MLGSSDDLHEVFRDYISANNDKLCKSTTVDNNLLTKLVQEGVLNQYRRETIDKSSNVNYDKAVALYNVLANKADDLPKILGVFKKTGDNEAERILEIFAKTNNVTLQESIPGSSQPAKKLKNATPPIPSTEQLSIRPIQLRGKIQRVERTLKESQSGLPPKALLNIENAVSAVQQVYTAGAKFKGVALIVNVVTFDMELQFNTRRGAERDTEKLTEVLRLRNFDVFHLLDPTLLEFQDAIKECQSMSYEDADSFLLAVMSHGDGEKILTKDNQYLEIWGGILKQFNDTNCPNLLRKPKIFILNYDRYRYSDIGSTGYDESPPSSPTSPPSWTDMLVCYSTLHGHRSFRHEYEGTWFIQILCGVLHQYGDTFDIITLLNLVSEVMKDLRSEHGDKQICPYYNIGFTKKFYV